MLGITLRKLCLSAFMTALLAIIGPIAGICQDVDQATELAKKLANPVASLISVPLQFNYDENYGLNDDGEKYFINVQPVIPFALSEDWNLISRTILPLVHLSDIPPGNDETGLGDITQSLFFSPSQPSSGGIIWGVGPVLLLPTATDELLGSEKWGAGPTAVVLKQTGPWTIGFLGNHVWSFAGEDDRTDINASYMQPFLAYVTKTHTTFNLNTESVYDWEAEQWSVPLNFQVSQLLKIGGQPISIGAGVRYWAESPDAGPEDWGGRLFLTFLFPK
ncbi:hypothetical protein SAMN05421830_106207 [Desulfomicrobium norvegicum]|uniref:MetA-pathway of phenol degradation n=1 Tax=Desulfomicrobium norvegicum (strain DSM 1741 / NCIMB 8310) TaxID=52561 RepID=A0A8G2C3E2_DESNO|nr:transporter [Desulfomicrobium norvegicum]SFL80026.1 hypothetical protein SAMN05421830_106207 [Desulfomicrobium norvegicum]